MKKKRSKTKYSLANTSPSIGYSLRYSFIYLILRPIRPIKLLIQMRGENSWQAKGSITTATNFSDLNQPQVHLNLALLNKVKSSNSNDSFHFTQHSTLNHARRSFAICYERTEEKSKAHWWELKICWNCFSAVMIKIRIYLRKKKTRKKKVKTKYSTTTTSKLVFTAQFFEFYK